MMPLGARMAATAFVVRSSIHSPWNAQSRFAAQPPNASSRLSGSGQRGRQRGENCLVRLTGLGRLPISELIKSGDIEFAKVGSSTLIIGSSRRLFIDARRSPAPHASNDAAARSLALDKTGQSSCLEQMHKQSFSQTQIGLGLALILAAFAVPAAAGGAAADTDRASKGVYRLPFADGTEVKVFDDFRTHRPGGRIDLFGVGGKAPYRVVAAADGRIVAIQDGYSEQQSGRAAKDCHNNYIWIAHPNGEWTNYSHVAHGSVTGAAHLHVGDKVKAGQFLGFEGAVGCAMLYHVHFEVAVPAGSPGIDEGGFLTANSDSSREREPRFCGVPNGIVEKDHVYRASACR